MKISPNMKLFASILCFFKYDSVKIAANQVAKHCADVDAEDFKRVKFPECERGREVVEGVSHAVGEAAYDEERHREKQRKDVLLLCKSHCSGHKKAAADSEDSAAEGTRTQAQLNDILSGRLDVHRRNAREKCRQEASKDVSKEDEEEFPHLVFVYISGCAGVKLEPISNYRHKSKAEEHCTHERSVDLALYAGGKEAETGDTDVYTGEN